MQVLSKAYANGRPTQLLFKVFLGEAYQTENCKMCGCFCLRTKKERTFRLKLLLTESALCPQPVQVASDLKPSTSVWSVLALEREAVAPEKDSGSRDPRHHHSLAPKTSSGVRAWHRPHSPVLHKTKTIEVALPVKQWN